MLSVDIIRYVYEWINLGWLDNNINYKIRASLMHSDNNYVTTKMKGQSEIAYLPKFAITMLIVMVIVIIEML